MGKVTTFWLVFVFNTAAVPTVDHVTGGFKLEVDCNRNPVGAAGQEMTTLLLFVRAIFNFMENISKASA